MSIVKAPKWVSAGALVALGIVYGDIGTSPLYTMNSILNSARSVAQIQEFCAGFRVVGLLDIDVDYNGQICPDCTASR